MFIWETEHKTESVWEDSVLRIYELCIKSTWEQLENWKPMNHDDDDDAAIDNL